MERTYLVRNNDYYALDTGGFGGGKNDHPRNNGKNNSQRYLLKSSIFDCVLSLLIPDRFIILII